MNGGEAVEENLIVLCPNCHQALDSSPREVEFTSFLAELLRRSSRFESVRLEALIGRTVHFRADLLAERKSVGGREKLLIECKTSPVTAGRLQDVIAQIRKYQSVYDPSIAVFAVPATLSDLDRQILATNDIELWDLDFIASQFKAEIAASTAGYYKLLFQAHAGRSSASSTEHILIQKLKTTQPGRKDWSVYQSLIGEILEYLFCPTLVKPISELSDATKTNRRDFILPNYSESGFWAFLRNRYSADYVVVDAKNYTGKINKSQVLQIANYLKLHGAGLFGVIFSRKGGDSGGCVVTLREQWALHQKMILVLADEDVEAMLLAKFDGRAPEEVIGRKIEDFRLSV